MKKLTDEIIQFFQNQGCVIVSTIDKNGSPHSSCKGIVKINRNGRIYLLDLYQNRAYANLKHNPRIAVTAVDEQRFKGYCLKGKAKIIAGNKLASAIIAAWEDRVTSRITQRVLNNIRAEKGHFQHPEALLPKPKYLIVMEVEDIVDLSPHNIGREV